MHHICKGGCGGTSDNEGVCQTEGCPNIGHPMEACDCTDGQHGASSDASQMAEQQEASEAPASSSESTEQPN